MGRKEVGKDGMGQGCPKSEMGQGYPKNKMGRGSPKYIMYWPSKNAGQ